MFCVLYQLMTIPLSIDGHLAVTLVFVCRHSWSERPLARGHSNTVFLVIQYTKHGLQLRDKSSSRHWLFCQINLGVTIAFRQSVFIICHGGFLLVCLPVSLPDHLYSYPASNSVPHIFNFWWIQCVGTLIFPPSQFNTPFYVIVVFLSKHASYMDMISCPVCNSKGFLRAVLIFLRYVRISN